MAFLTTLLLDIDFTDKGNSNAYVRQGWSNPEATHRWTLGAESQIALPAHAVQEGAVLVLCATPCLYPPALQSQAVMVALDGRLLATVSFEGLHVAAWRLPPRAVGGDAVLSLLHLHHAAPRGPGQVRNGQSLGLMVHSLRVFLPAADRRVPELADAHPPRRALPAHFESIGQGCQFGLIQRRCNVEPHGLLRFVDTTTPALYEALCDGFAQLDAPGQLTLHPTDKPRPTWRWRHAGYNLRFDTWAPVDATDPDTLIGQQIRRLTFLRRKFFEDVAAADKTFVLTRGDCLTESEALAVFCALSLYGPATLLWTVFGDAARAGLVERVASGFLRGELGVVDAERYAALDVWRALMVNAWALVNGRRKKGLLF